MALRNLRTVACLLFGSAVVSTGLASRVGGAPPPPSVRLAPQEAAQAQADDSASLRQGLVTAIGERGERLQVQGIWLDVVAGQTQVLRNGQPVRLDSLQTGQTIRFTLAPGSPERPALRVVYAP